MSDEERYLMIGGERIRQLTDKEFLEESIRLGRPVSDELRREVEKQEQIERDIAQMHSDHEKEADKRKAENDRRRSKLEAEELAARREAMRQRLEPTRLAERLAWLAAGGDAAQFDSKVWPERATTHAVRIAAEEDAEAHRKLASTYAGQF